MSALSDESIASLMALGFEKNEAAKALQTSGGNVEQAANALLSPAPASTTPAVSTADLSTIGPPIQGSISQYDLPDGRSACSCIALAAATAFVKNPSTPISPDFLDTAVRDGHAAYLEWRSFSESSIEHNSPEEVLALFPHVQLDGSVRQGLLPSWEPLLREISSNGMSWTAVVVTKAPETILVLLSSDQYWLVDSHSRPPRTTAAWAQSFATLPQLCAALSQLFPPTVISDVPDTLLMMYNSYDLYPLMRSTQDANAGD